MTQGTRFIIGAITLVTAACGGDTTAPRAATPAEELAIAASPRAIAAVAASVSQVPQVNGQPNPATFCSAQGYGFGFKVDNIWDGAPRTYTVASNGITYGSLTVSGSGADISWSSSFGVDVVAVHGGAMFNVYSYAPEATSGSNATATWSTTNAKSGKTQTFHPGVSAVNFCFDLELGAAAAIAQTSYDRNWSWSIAKTASATSLALAANTAQDVGYTVTVTPTKADANFAIDGSFSLSNATFLSAVVSAVSSDLGSVNCGPLPFTLAPGATKQCALHADVADATTRTITVTATTSGSAVAASGGSVYGSGLVGGATAQATAVFGAPTSETDETIGVTDAFNGAAESALGSATRTTQQFTYTKAIGGYACGTGAHAVSNTAAYTAADSDAKGSATATVTANVAACPPPPPPPPGDPEFSGTETAFAQGSITFASLGFARWGWASPLAAGSYSLIAGQHYDVGTVAVSISGGQATFTITLKAGYTLSGTAIHVGDTQAPIRCTGPVESQSCAATVAPGQYAYSSSASGVTTVTLTTPVGGYFILHTNVTGQ